MHSAPHFGTQALRPPLRGVARYLRGARRAANRCSRMENPGPSSAPLISDDPSQRYQRGLNTLKDTQRMVR